MTHTPHTRMHKIRLIYIPLSSNKHTRMPKVYRNAKTKEQTHTKVIRKSPKKEEFHAPEYTHSQRSTRRGSFITATERTAREVEFAIWSLYNDDLGKLPLAKQPLERVIEGIKGARGIDDRTVAKWLKAFSESGIIQLNKTERQKMNDIMKVLGVRTIDQVLNENPVLVSRNKKSAYSMKYAS